MRAAAERVVELAERAIAARGRFHWALAGGSTRARCPSRIVLPKSARSTTTCGVPGAGDAGRVLELVLIKMVSIELLILSSKR